jgi:hypothetical protein
MNSSSSRLSNCSGAWTPPQISALQAFTDEVQPSMETCGQMVLKPDWLKR